MTNQATHIINGREFLFIETPKDAHNLEIVKNALWFRYREPGQLRKFSSITLIEGPWKLVGTSESMSEEEKAKLLPKMKDTSYPFEEGDSEDAFRYLGLDPINNTIVILEKEK